MNYLSHFYFDQQHPNSYRITGIALPDLTKTYSRSWNIHPAKNKILWENHPELQSIYEGWERHLEVDKLFHSSSYFVEKTALLKQEFKQVAFESELIRPSVLAHIGLEIILDAILLKEKKVDAQIYYNHLRLADPENIHLFLTHNGFSETSPFFTMFNRFNDAQYLFSYVNNESLAYALKRIIQRIWNIELNKSENLQVQQALEKSTRLIQTDYMSIFAEIQNHLKP